MKAKMAEKGGTKGSASPVMSRAVVPLKAVEKKRFMDETMDEILREILREFELSRARVERKLRILSRAIAEKLENEADRHAPG